MLNNNLPKNIFRAYDIRGKADLLGEYAEIIGKAVGTYFVRKGQNKLVIGRDNRKSSKDLKENFVRGLLSCGCEVMDIGLSSSPLLYFTVINNMMDGGINVTGSHLPPTENGFKIVGEKAYPIATLEIEKIRDIALNSDFATGNGKYYEGNSVESYFKNIRNPIQLNRSLKIVIDCGNGITGLFAPKVFKNLGCKVIELYCNLDDSFPNHLPDPEKEENILDLKKKVIENKADVGLAFDGDGDRLGVVDETGTYRETDFVLILLARDYLSRHPGDKILFDVKSSQNVIDDIRASGGIPTLWKTGHSLIKQKMREEGILLGAEFSGHIFAFEDYYPFDDALYAGSKLLNILSSSKEPLSTHWNGLTRRYPTHLIELPCSDEKKFDIIQNIVDQVSSKYDVITIDGARITFEHGWTVIRASNTSPNLTVRFEADSPEYLSEIIRRVEKLLIAYHEIDIKPLQNLLDEVLNNYSLTNK